MLWWHKYHGQLLLSDLYTVSATYPCRTIICGIFKFVGYDIGVIPSMENDPHFFLPLANGDHLCFSIQGEPDLSFKLIDDKYAYSLMVSLFYLLRMRVTLFQKLQLLWKVLLSRISQSLWMSPILYPSMSILMYKPVD